MSKINKEDLLGKEEVGGIGGQAPQANKEYEDKIDKLTQKFLEKYLDEN